MELELRHLRTVRAIAEAGSLTRASVSLGLAQPALSTQLRRIERLLGGPLFERGRSGVRPTPLGELVLERARVLLPAAQELQEAAVRFANAPRDRRFRLGATHGPLLGALVDRLAAEYPAAAVTTATSWSTQELTGRIASGRLDFVLAGVCGQSLPEGDGRLAWREVGTDPVFALLGEGHPLAGQPELALAELAAERWAVVPGEGCFADCFSAACSRAGFTPAAMYETDTASCVHLAQVGRAVGLARATFPPTAGVVTVPITGDPLTWRHLLGWQPESPAAGAAAELTEYARWAHGEAAGRSPSYAAWLARQAP